MTLSKRLERLEEILGKLEEDQRGPDNLFVRSINEPQLTREELVELGATPQQIAVVETVAAMDATIPITPQESP